jgi:enoyl-CoA hydratase/carnithine racemase
MTYVLVQSKLPDRPQGIILMRPYARHVEDIPVILLRLLRVHHLGEDVPAGILAAFDRLEQITRVGVGVLAGQLFGFLAGQVLDALVGLEVDLDVFKRPVLVLLVQVCRFIYWCKRTGLVNL